MTKSKRRSNTDKAYLRKITMSPMQRCGICNKFLNSRGLPNRSGVCSGCRNDCTNKQFGRIKINIEKRIEKAIQDYSQTHGKVSE